MKKGLLINAFEDSGWIGGLYYKKNIAFQLTQSSSINIRINVITSKDVKLFNDIKGLRVFYCNKGRFYRLRKALIMLLHSIRYEYPFFREVKRGNIININWIPDFQHKYYPDYFTSEELNRRDAKCIAISKSDMPVIFSSNDCLNDFNKFYCNNKDNAYVVPFVSFIEPDIEAVKGKEMKIISKYNLSNSIYAVIMNQFWQHKNHIVVFQALEKYYSDNPESNFRFVFTGQMDDYRNPDYIDSLKKIVENPKVAPHIDILGFIDRSEQITLMKNAAFVIQPSLFEGWGTVVEDAKVLDKTILLSDIPVHREQMNEKCILFDPHDPTALAELIYQESQKEHNDDVEKGIADMHKRAKEYTKGFEQMLRDMEN